MKILSTRKVESRFQVFVSSLALLIFMLFSTTMDAAIHSFDDGNFRYSVLSQTGTTGTVSIDKRAGISIDGALTIPSQVTYKGITFKVTEIESFAFDECGITSLVIPQTITKIGNSAFFKCIKLTGTLTIPGSVATIGDYAFHRCTGIQGLVLSEGIKSIGYSAFTGLSSLKGELKLPMSLVSIGHYAFSENSGLTGTLTIPDNVTKVGNNAFDECTGLQAVVISDGIKELHGEYIFCNCTGLKSYHLSNTLTIIPSGLFKDCVGLNGKLQIPSSVTQIGSEAFSNCSGLTGTLVIPNKVTKIGSDAFSSCKGLTGTLTIPNSVVSIDFNAFAICKFQSIAIPNSVTQIGLNAFSSKVKHITTPSTLTNFDSFSDASEITIPKFDDVSKIYNSGSCTSLFYLSESLPQKTYNGKDNTFYKNKYFVNLYLKPSVFAKYNTSTEGDWWKSNRNMTDKIPLTIPTDRSYVTMCRDFDVDFRHTNDNLPSGVSPLKAYIVSDIDEASNAIILQEIKYVPSRLRSNEEGFTGYDEYVGVLLKGTPGYTYYYTIGEDDYTKGKDGQMTLEKALALSNASVPTSYATLVGANDPKYVTTEETVDGTTYKTYGLKNNEFCKYSADGYVPYNKAYLRIPATYSPAAKETVTLIFHDADGTTTSISSSILSKAKYGNNFIYDLQGMRITHPTKGKVYIQDGKKRLQK